jgi:uncharacterized protein YbjT (DUF2867 family)
VKVIIFGATGMLGQGVLRECLLDKDVIAVLALGRRDTGQRHPKLREIRHEDFGDFSSIEGDLAGYDACFFCLGVSSAGMNEADYRRLTYDVTLAAAHAVLARNPELTFVYVSGQGTDTSEQGRTMWARVKGRTENELLKLTSRAYMFRPGYIQPMHGIRSRTKVYAMLYAVGAPLYPVLRRLAPNQVTTTERLGRAMIEVARRGAPQRVLNTAAINEMAG